MKSSSAAIERTATTGMDPARLCMYIRIREKSVSGMPMYQMASNSWPTVVWRIGSAQTKPNADKVANRIR